MHTLIEERDACAIIALVNKLGDSTHATIVKTIDALKKMGHRSGDINGEGDGCGISVDLPRQIWARHLTAAGLSPHLAESNHFFIGHFLIPRDLRGQAAAVCAQISRLFPAHQAEILLERKGATRDQELGPRARRDAPLFWQVAGMIDCADRRQGARRLFELQMAIERQLPTVHIASLSLDTAVYKVQGIPDLLPRVYPELMDPAMGSAMTLGHGRYSTNTLPTVERSQPFSLLGHNGEINTIERLRTTGRALDIEPVPGGSDSQDLNRIIDGLIHRFDLDLLEAMEMVFPAVYSEVSCYPPELQQLYAGYRWFFPCSAQGPAAVVARYGNTCFGSVDALGLRPLWFGESDYNYFFSSEKGVVDLERTLSDPKPLGPGEKIAIIGGRGMRAEVLDYNSYQQRLIKLSRGRAHFPMGSLLHGLPEQRPPRQHHPAASPLSRPQHLAAFGWRQYDLTIRRKVSETGREVIGSMGHTGPLAAFVPEALPNLADYAKENVAVVTNPAIDRERELEHFSTRIILGSRPDAAGRGSALGVELMTPLLLDYAALAGHLDPDEAHRLAQQYGTALHEGLLDFFTGQNRDSGRLALLDATFLPATGLSSRLRELCRQAITAVNQGAVLIVTDDAAAFTDGRVFIDPSLLTAALNEALLDAGLRRNAALIVRSGAIRNLHDIMFNLGLGADAITPYLLWRHAMEYCTETLTAADIVANNMDVLQKGMEKVMSTMGIHELCGYGRIFSTIGLNAELAAIMRLPNFCQDAELGCGLQHFEDLAAKRLAAAADPQHAVFRDPKRNPKVGKILRKVAVGKAGYLELDQQLGAMDENQPTGIRHLLDFVLQPEDQQLTADQVDITVGDHAMPLVIAAMSFGAQGENSFRAYAEAARKANIICMNGEGGEIPDMLGRYRKNRGQQLASGRFGVFMGFINSADFLEIKIGQGAKPGEGGHLPGTKVSEMVASARHCKPGITLISPSNHHDIYSIEDLAQIITELKTANPHARVSVKIPITSGVGTIAVGIAKAGADIINLSGFEGGTGAAREHAKRWVGLPAEIGITEAHKALLASCLRDRVELWVDGGMRSGADVLKMILLGANRVGMGTVALMGVGCISCERCHLDRCPRGISTQLRTIEEAKARGVKAFSPRIMEEEAENLARLLTAIGEQIKALMAAMGVRHIQELVGRSDLLRQTRMTDRISAAELLAPPSYICDPAQFLIPKVVRKPLNHLTRLISDLAMQRFAMGREEVTFVEERVHSTDRAVGTYLAGSIERYYGGEADQVAHLRLDASVPGNGLCAFTTANVEVVVEGGAQDGAAKGSIGGFLAILKGKNLRGQRIDGSTGKSFAYGAIDGFFMVQNMADSRACIRMSGGSVVFGGRLTEPLRDELGNLASRAHLKGFAFEYMTGGRVVVLGDPGPWICAGMTGGVVYQCLYPELGLDRKAIRRRLSRGANVTLKTMDQQGLADCRQLLNRYIDELEKNYQHEEAVLVREIHDQAADRFIALVPRRLRPHSAE